MSSSLDDLIEGLRVSPTDADLSGITPGAWHRIAKIRRARSIDLWLLPARIGAVVFAMTAGAVLGAAHARESTEQLEVAAFEVESPLAPSTLLDKRSWR